MRIVVDLQGAQSSSSRERGIGRYSLALTRALTRNCGEHEILLALSGLFPDTIEPIRAEFRDLLPTENIRVWRAPGPLSQLDPGNSWRRQSAELVREAFLASLKPDVVLVCSLFEGLVDDAATSVSCLSSSIPTAVILYDLIPLLNRSHYLNNPPVEIWYENKLAHLRRAGLLLAISESSRQEGINHLGFPPGSVVNISTAADAHFRVQAYSDEYQADMRRKYRLLKPYLMYTGGSDPRKNIEGLIRAYASLSVSLRQSHQLAVVCTIQPPERARLETLARQQGLDSGELILTGYVPENDLVALYGLCKAFVFPSWHEGFGLPVLEAMSCGRAVIGAATSSIPEVINYPEALFDPLDDASVTEKLRQVLADEPFRHRLEQHGLRQAKNFSWDESAQRAIAALIQFAAEHKNAITFPAAPAGRPRLAYVSPLPPERSGISDYSTELLDELQRHYVIDVVATQPEVSVASIIANCSIRSVAWFRAHADDYDRVIYHFGNSPYHRHMFQLAQDIPGVIVLHDFFLSHVIADNDKTGYMPGAFSQALYQSHGYTALRQQYHPTEGADDLVWRYPCNFPLIQCALGVIVHAENSRRLAEQWYGRGVADSWRIIPHLRVPPAEMNRATARRHLNLAENDFVVCSFGQLGPTKLNHRLLETWLRTDAAKSRTSVLIFVGELPPGDYRIQMQTAIRRAGIGKQVRVTGWTDTNEFRQYLAAADVAVQLRTLSRGETSGAVLDCMNHGLPTIVNANGSMADLPEDGVLKLPDNFDNAELTAAIDSLWCDPFRRQQLGSAARNIIRECHQPRTCAAMYAQAIEEAYLRKSTGVSGLIKALASMDQIPAAQQELVALAAAVDRSIPPQPALRQLLVDISVLVQQDAKSGIQRVVRSILKELLVHPPAGYQVEPVYATADQGHRYARRFTLRLLDCPESLLEDEPVSYQAGDCFLGLDLSHQIVITRQADLKQMQRHGVKLWFTIYDLLPLQMPDAFPDGVAQLHQQWLETLLDFGNAICISRAVADEVAAWHKTGSSERILPGEIAWFHLGADIESSLPTRGMPSSAREVLDKLEQNLAFIVVGTLEPRKGHAQVLAAFNQLWQADQDVSLVIVGKQGWKVETLADQLQAHPERDKRLFWLEGISDEYLEKLYEASTCLLAASYAEGFGLPLIEAAQHKLPIIARDIPIFREVAGAHAWYFDNSYEPSDIAISIRVWLEHYRQNQHPDPKGMPWHTWKESARQLLDAILVDRESAKKEEIILQSKNLQATKG